MKTILTLLLFSFYTISFSQVKVVVKQYNKTDSTRILGFSIENINPQLDKLIEKLGTPDQQTAGNISWNTYQFPFLDKEVKILIQDGIWEYKSNYSKFTPFENEQIKKSFKNQPNKRLFRGIQIEVLHQKKNIINSKKLENQFLTYFNQLLSE